MGSNFRVFHDTELFYEYLSHKNLLSWVEFEQYRSKNEILTGEIMKIRPHKNILLDESAVTVNS